MEGISAGRFFGRLFSCVKRGAERWKDQWNALHSYASAQGKNAGGNALCGLKKRICFRTVKIAGQRGIQCRNTLHCAALHVK